jgi:hypothetical protein
MMFFLPNKSPIMLEVVLAKMLRSEPMDEKKSCVCNDRLDCVDIVELDLVSPGCRGTGDICCCRSVGGRRCAVDSSVIVVVEEGVPGAVRSAEAEVVGVGVDGCAAAEAPALFKASWSLSVVASMLL